MSVHIKVGRYCLGCRSVFFLHAISEVNIELLGIIFCGTSYTHLKLYINTIAAYRC